MQDPRNALNASKKRYWIRFAALAALLSCVSPISAHESADHYHSDAKPHAKTVLSKIDKMQSAIRQKLKRVLVGDGLQQRTQVGPQRSHRSDRYQHSQLAVRGGNQVTAIGSDGSPLLIDREQAIQRTRPFDEDERPQSSMREEIDRAQYRQTPIPADSGFRPAQEPGPAEVFANDYAQPIPAPLRPVSRRPVPVTRRRLQSEPSATYADRQLSSNSLVGQNAAALSNVATPGSSEGPVIGGIRLGQPQVTATERAIDLMRENQVLRSARDSALADNQRLRDQLASAKSLLARSNTAMTAARGELQSAEVTNKSLRQKIVDLETQHRKSLIETDRILSSLRDELDEVLVSEINFNAN